MRLPLRRRRRAVGFVSELRGPIALAHRAADRRRARRGPRRARGARRRAPPTAASRSPASASTSSRRSVTYHAAAPGALAEWLGSGLQSRLQQFESARRLSDERSTPRLGRVDRNGMASPSSECDRRRALSSRSPLAAARRSGCSSRPAPRRRTRRSDVTMRPATMPLSFKLPFYWERQQTPRGYALLLAGGRPHGGARRLQMHGKVTNGSRAGERRRRPDRARSTAASIRPRGAGVARRAAGGCRYQGRRSLHQVEAGTGEGVAVLYFLSHGSHGYAFMFHTGPRALPTWNKVFTHTARTIRWSGSSL